MLANDVVLSVWQKQIPRSGCEWLLGVGRVPAVVFGVISQTLPVRLWLF